MTDISGYKEFSVIYFMSLSIACKRKGEQENECKCTSALQKKKNSLKNVFTNNKLKI